MDYLYSLYDALVSILVPSDKARALVDTMERDMGTELETKEKPRPREHRFASVRVALRREMDLLRSDIAKGRQPFRSDLRVEFAALLRSITLRFAAMLAISVAVTISVILGALRPWL